MILLGLEFSSARRSAAVLSPVGTSSAEAWSQGESGTDAMALIERALHVAGLAPEAVEGIVVGLGPGSYAGVRSAIALAQGWRLARGVRLAGVSSVLAAAAEAQRQGCRGVIHVAVDAQREEAYLGTFELTEQSCIEKAPLRLTGMEPVRLLAREGQAVMGPGVSLWCPCARDLWPTGSRLVEMVAKDGSHQHADDLEPIYLREVRFVKSVSAFQAGTRAG